MAASKINYKSRGPRFNWCHIYAATDKIGAYCMPLNSVVGNNSEDVGTYFLCPIS